MRFEYDLSSAPVLRAVPDGVYLLKIVGSKESKSKKSNNDQIQWEFEILEPQSVIVDGAPVKQLYIYMSVTEKSLGFVRELWDACDKLTPGTGFDTVDLYGCTFGALIVKRPGTPEFPNESNAISKYFKAGNMPAPGLK